MTNIYPPLGGNLVQLSVGYGGKVLASDLSVALRPGQLVCLLGRNGAGKSTLLRTMAGLQKPLSGSVLIGGKAVPELSLKEMARMVGLVTTLRPDADLITARELVAFGRSPYTGFFGALSVDDNRLVDEALALVGIGDLASRHVSTLSDGERQKAMVAKVLSQQTPVILLDEPTAFLDFPSSVDLFRLLRRLAHEERKSILLTTHDIHLAQRYADVLWLLDGSLTVKEAPFSEGVLYEFFGMEESNI